MATVKQATMATTRDTPITVEMALESLDPGPNIGNPIPALLHMSRKILRKLHNRPRPQFPVCKMGMITVY